MRPPPAPYARSEPGVLWALVAAVGGMAFGVVALLIGTVVLIGAGGDLASNFALESPALNGFVIGIPALVLGPIAYFLGRSSVRRIAESEGNLGGRPVATAAWVFAVVATALGALTTLGWFVLMLLGSFGSPPS
jgi:hypothetical protein